MEAVVVARVVIPFDYTIRSADINGTEIDDTNDRVGAAKYAESTILDHVKALISGTNYELIYLGVEEVRDSG